jgi:LPS export ABC transporter protein LptC
MRSAVKRRRNLKRRVVTIASSLAGVALLYGLLSGREESDVEFGKAAAQRGYYMNDATLTEMGKDGRPRVIVHAANIEQQLSDQSVRLSQLELDYQTKESGNWHVTAREGDMPADRKSIQLAGDVAITGVESRGEALIRTERLSYDIDDAIVQTEEPVSVRFGPHLLKARGLRAELNAGTLKLESDVNGHFVP